MNERSNEPLYAEDRRSGCLGICVAVAVVCGLYALPGVAMAVIGWLTGGAR